MFWQSQQFRNPEWVSLVVSWVISRASSFWRLWGEKLVPGLFAASCDHLYSLACSPSLRPQKAHSNLCLRPRTPFSSEASSLSLIRTIILDNPGSSVLHLITCVQSLFPCKVMFTGSRDGHIWGPLFSSRPHPFTYFLFAVLCLVTQSCLTLYNHAYLHKNTNTNTYTKNKH